MANNSLIVDEAYIHNMQGYFKNKAYEMETVIKKYLTVLKSVRSNAITGGAVAEALTDYIVYAQQLQDQLPEMARIIDIQLNNYIKSIDNADQFLY